MRSIINIKGERWSSKVKLWPRFIELTSFSINYMEGYFMYLCESTTHLYKDKNKTSKRLCIGNVRWIFVLWTFSIGNNFFCNLVILKENVNFVCWNFLWCGKYHPCFQWLNLKGLFCKLRIVRKRINCHVLGERYFNNRFIL